MSTGLGFYLRLSMADGDLGKDNKDESNSIENQRELLQNFVESKEEFTDEIFEYIDDGYTGTNFNRPAFRRMIEDAKKDGYILSLSKTFPASAEIISVWATIWNRYFPCLVFVLLQSIPTMTATDI